MTDLEKAETKTEDYCKGGSNQDVSEIQQQIEQQINDTKNLSNFHDWQQEEDAAAADRELTRTIGQVEQPKEERRQLEERIQEIKEKLQDTPKEERPESVQEEIRLLQEKIWQLQKERLRHLRDRNKLGLITETEEQEQSFLENERPHQLKYKRYKWYQLDEIEEQELCWFEKEALKEEVNTLEYRLCKKKDSTQLIKNQHQFEEEILGLRDEFYQFKDKFQLGVFHKLGEVDELKEELEQLWSKFHQLQNKQKEADLLRWTELVELEEKQKLVNLNKEEQELLQSKEQELLQSKEEVIRSVLENRSDMSKCYFWQNKAKQEQFYDYLLTQKKSLARETRQDQETQQEDTTNIDKELCYNILQWTRDYVSSPLYKQRLEKIYWSSAESELERRKKVLDQPRDFRHSTNGSRYRFEKGCHIVEIWDDAKFLSDNTETIIAHEIAHALNSSARAGTGVGWQEYQFLLERNEYNRNVDGTFIFNPREINKNTDLKAFDNGYEYGIPETLSDLYGFRQLLYKEGVLNASTDIVTQEVLEKIKTDERFTSDMCTRRLLVRFPDIKKLVEIMNTIADLPSERDNSLLMA